MATVLDAIVNKNFFFFRREVVSKKLPDETGLLDLPSEHFDYSRVCLTLIFLILV